MERRFHIGDRVRIRKGFGTRGLTGTIIEARRRNIYMVATDQIGFARSLWKLVGRLLDPTRIPASRSQTT
jgi:hypothetical protein